MWKHRFAAANSCCLVRLLAMGCALGFFGAWPPVAGPQERQGQQQTPFPSEPTTVEVSVRETSGGPLATVAMVRLYSNMNRVNQTMPTRDAGTASFSRIFPGEYDVEVQAAGYQTTTEHAAVFGSGGNYRIFVYMRPEGETTGSVAPSGTSMSPKLQGEIDRGLERMKKEQYATAEECFEKVVKLAPGNPDVQYLWGMAAYAQKKTGDARKRFETALSIQPTHERALLQLGELQLKGGEPAAAAKTFEKAYQVNGAVWRTHFLLAYAYVQTKEIDKAEIHAARAVELGKEKAVSARLLLGKIQAAAGKTEDAKKNFEEVVRANPNDSAGREAGLQLESIRRSEAASAGEEKQAVSLSSLAPLVAVSSLSSSPIPSPTPAEMRAWAPPDVDSKEYPVAPDVSCGEDELRARAGKRMLQQLENFEKFSATELIEHQEVDGAGIPGKARSKEFSYLVFIHWAKKDSFYLDELRDGGENLSEFPTSLATKGLVAMGVTLFDKNYESDFLYKCEGLGKWRGQPAWQVRWEQKKDAPSRILTWRNNRGLFPVPLRGRVWLAANSYDVLHLESDLREPVRELELSRDHLTIDYGPVKFEKGGKELWLPWYAEMFMEFRGKRYHHKHTLANYSFFSVGYAEKIAAPKEQPLEQKEH